MQSFHCWGVIANEVMQTMTFEWMDCRASLAMTGKKTQ